MQHFLTEDVFMVSTMSESIKIFCWNVRGLNSPARREALLHLVQVSNPTILCIQETKLSVIDSSLASEFLGHRLNNFQYLPSDGTKGESLLHGTLISSQ